jgi:D-amino-acid dehydrogenase
MTMRVAVVGAGIVGVTTAYELAALGLEVTVFERRNSVAAEASFADAGVLSAGYVAPWTAPGLRLQLLQRLLSRPAAVRLGGWNALPHLPWLWRWWRACRPQVHAGHRAALQRLAQFSCERLLELTRLLRLDFQQMPGFLVLLRTERDLARAQPGLALLREAGVAHDVVDAARCRQLEPGLSPETALAAAIHLPQDGVGNCRHFAHLLKAEAQRLGAGFRFDTEVRSLAPGARPTLATGDGRVHEFDAVVLCAGVQANALLASIGLKLPLAPIHGHSVTAPVRHIDGHPPPGPRAALMDEGHRVTITRLGQRIRVAGVAEVGGRLDRIDPAALRSLYRVLDDWFPGAALTRQAQHWKGAQPTLPDGAPVLGASGAPGVWLNLGHGASGWTLACGSARVLAETVAGREAPLDMSGLTAERLR